MYVLADRAAAWVLSRPPQPYPKTHFADGNVILNSRSYRDYEYPLEKPPGVFRVLAIGDSFTQGGGVSFDGIWPKRLERNLTVLENVRGVRYQVLNWGWPGASTPGETDNVFEDAPAWRPDLIVIGYCLNDAEDAADRKGVRALRRANRAEPFEKGEGLLGWLHEHSALVRLVRLRLHATRTNRGMVKYYRAIYKNDYRGWQWTRTAIAALGKWSTEKSVPVVVMIFPLFSWDLDDRYPFSGIHAMVHAELEQAGLPYLDLFDAYRGIEHRVLEAVPFEDPHPSDVAHRIAAEELYLFIRDRGYLPKGEPIAADPRQRRIAPPWN
jgi:lysophospholipase L1-like esterase